MFQTETRLATLIREQGRLKGWVAARLGCGPERMARLIAGEREMSLAEAVRLGEIFGVAPESFLAHDGGGEREEGE
jgi:plasmid maintenance system antidote protein VapI